LKLAVGESNVSPIESKIVEVNHNLNADSTRRSEIQRCMRCIHC
jgi:hypothetical protein